jgi:maltose alpha-D-glucosyltransferase/alpha-amylase
MEHMESRSQEWWQHGVFYSLYVDQFAGDFPGLTSKLDYFTELGVDCLHLLPHYPSPLDDDGYDISDHTGVRPELGTVDDFKAFCTAAHERGLKVMVDLVLNHVSMEHPWFVEARSSRDNPKRDFFHWSETGREFSNQPINFPDFKQGSNWIWNEATNDHYYAFFKPSQPDLNWQNPAVQAAMFEVVDTLASYGVDGFRLDAVGFLVERDGSEKWWDLPETHDRIRDLRQHLKEHHPDLILLGEVIDRNDVARPYFGRGDECHLVYSAELMAEMLYALKLGDRADRLRTVLETSRNLPPHSAWLAFLRNHDSVSLGTLGYERAEELRHAFDPERRFCFSNCADTAQRLFSLLDEDMTRMRDAFSMLAALPLPIVLYYGDEIAMPNAHLPEGETDMRRTGRAAFDWLEAERQRQDERSLFHHVRKQLAQRKVKTAGA